MTEAISCSSLSAAGLPPRRFLNTTIETATRRQRLVGVPVLLQRYSAGRLQHRLPGPLRLVLVLVVVLLVLLLRLLLLTLSPPQCPPVDWRITRCGNCLSGPQVHLS